MEFLFQKLFLYFSTGFRFGFRFGFHRNLLAWVWVLPKPKKWFRLFTIAWILSRVDPVLKPIEYDKVDIGTISVEIKHAGKIFDGTREDIKELLGNNGYAFVTFVHIDDIFTKKKCPTCISKQSLELY